MFLVVCVVLSGLLVMSSVALLTRLITFFKQLLFPLNFWCEVTSKHYFFRSLDFKKNDNASVVHGDYHLNYPQEQNANHLLQLPSNWKPKCDDNLEEPIDLSMNKKGMAYTQNMYIQFQFTLNIRNPERPRFERSSLGRFFRVSNAKNQFKTCFLSINLPPFCIKSRTGLFSSASLERFGMNKTFLMTLFFIKRSRLVLGLFCPGFGRSDIQIPGTGRKWPFKPGLVRVSDE
jgi:hypothetical protein